MKLHMVIETVLVCVGAFFVLKDKRIGYYLCGAAVGLFVINLFF